MTSEQLDENLSDSYIRLKRQYLICFDRYDRASLKDLAHALRLWVDMKVHVNEYLAARKPEILFYDYSLPDIVKKAIKGGEHIIAYFPATVTTRLNSSTSPNNGVIISGPMGVHYSPGLDMIMSANPRRIAPDVIALHRIVFAFNKEKTENFAQIDQVLYIIKKVKFGIWFDNLALHVSLRNDAGILENHYITRTIIINRMANARGASHPVGGQESQNKYDAVVDRLFDYVVLEKPLPYLLLLSIAKEIVVNFSYLASI